MAKDILIRFIFDNAGVRGTWVNLERAWQDTKLHQNLPAIAETLLGQALAAATLISSTIKVEGSVILQAQGDGDLTALVTQATDQRKVRGMIRCSTEAGEINLSDMLGDGYLALSIERGDSAPYQGIVPVQTPKLSQAIEDYFVKSEQIATRLWLAADSKNAAGLLLQTMPDKEPQDGSFQHLSILADTLKNEELLRLDCETLLQRLFHQEEVVLFEEEPVEFQCKCSKERIESTLSAMGRDELDKLFDEQGKIEVKCEFCSQIYSFSHEPVH